jgi:hypothetical protein
MIRYDLIVQDAMLGVVRKVLVDTEKNGLHGDHHFYLTYSTNFAGVEIPSHLKEKYPDEITIVLQHEFENLKVSESQFSVTLWFNNVPAHLIVPFRSIKAFFDPSVKFGLQFNPVTESESNQVEANKTESVDENDAKKDDKSNNVVSLDSFRKK